MEISMLKCASFFAGVGGIDIGFENTGRFEVVYANEIDPYPVKTYEFNSKLKVDCRDIHDVKAEEIPDFDVMLAGFPCQAFSVAGYRKGFEDEKGRGTLFFELVRIIKAKQPQIVFLENVKNLVGHDNGNTFSIICEELKKEHYHVKYKVLNAMEYGNVPQNRERIYIVAFKEIEAYKSFEFPMPLQLTKALSDIIAFDVKQDEKYYYTEGKYKGDYVIQLKANQGNFHQEVYAMFDDKYMDEKEKENNYETFTTLEKSHGRIEKRTCYVINDTEYFTKYLEEWKGLKKIFAVKREVEKNEEITTEISCYISSKNATAEELLGYTRNHWKIESMHHILDVTYDEDRCTLLTKKAQENINLFRKMGVSIHKKYLQDKKQTVKSSMFNCLLNDNRLLEILQFCNNR